MAVSALTVVIPNFPLFNSFPLHRLRVLCKDRFFNLRASLSLPSTAESSTPWAEGGRRIQGCLRAD